MPKLIMFTRSFSCMDQELARHCLNELNVQPIEINISTDPDAAQTLIDWVGSLSVPTLAVADEAGHIAPPQPLGPGQRIRNADRGSLISEPNCDSLRAFLEKHGFITRHDRSSNN